MTNLVAKFRIIVGALALLALAIWFATSKCSTTHHGQS